MVKEAMNPLYQTTLERINKATTADCLNTVDESIQRLYNAKQLDDVEVTRLELALTDKLMALPIGV